MAVFGMETGAVHDLGVKVKNDASDFEANHRKINEVVNRLVSSAYTSSDALAIAEQIKSYEPLLNEIYTMIDNFGDNGIRDSQTTVATNEDITSRIAKNI